MDYLQIVNGGGVFVSLFSLILKPVLPTVLAGILATIFHLGKKVSVEESLKKRRKKNNPGEQ